MPLEHLRLERNNFRSGVVTLFTHPRLKTIDLRGNPLSQSTVTTIQTQTGIAINYSPRLIGNIEKLTSYEGDTKVSTSRLELGRPEDNHSTSAAPRPATASSGH